MNKQKLIKFGYYFLIGFIIAYFITFAILIYTPLFKQDYNNIYMNYDDKDCNITRILCFDKAKEKYCRNSLMFKDINIINKKTICNCNLQQCFK